MSHKISLIFCAKSCKTTQSVKSHRSELDCYCDWTASDVCETVTHTDSLPFWQTCKEWAEWLFGEIIKVCESVRTKPSAASGLLPVRPGLKKKRHRAETNHHFHYAP